MGLTRCYKTEGFFAFILPLCDFFWLSCPVLFFSGTRPGRTAEPIFTLYGSNDV